MEPTERILIRTYGLMVDADLAAGQLRAQGIECEIRTDDCAGMYPSMGVIQLLVAPEDAEDARQILKESVPVHSPATNQVEDRVPSRATTPPPRVYKFNWGLVVGALLGALLHYSYVTFEKYHDGDDWFDKDGDGRSEEERIWRRGENTEARFDRNGDSRIDVWCYYRKGQAWRDEMDDNFDGRVDAWLAYASNGFLSRAEFDTDRNGVRDVVWTYTNGLPVQADWRPNGTNLILLRQFIHHGVLDEEWRDQNGDGLFDVSIKFDPFSTPIRTNNLRPTTQSP